MHTLPPSDSASPDLARRTHAISMASVSVDRGGALGRLNGWKAECSCSWDGEVHGRPDTSPRFVCPAPDYRGMAANDAAEHQREAMRQDSLAAALREGSA
jgi:hypothetical protein